MNSLKLISGLITLTLVILLLIKLIKLPTFMLPSIYLAGILTVAILIGSLTLSGIVNLIFRKTSFFLVLCFFISTASIFLMFKFLSPVLTITVPKGFEGQVSLVLSNVNDNILAVDSHGIGYINKRTFDKTYHKPIVLETDGTDISNWCVGFNPSTFWGKGTFSVASAFKGPNEGEILFLSFEVTQKNNPGRKQYYSTDLERYVDKTKVCIEK